MKITFIYLFLLFSFCISFDGKRIDFREMAKDKKEMEVYTHDTQLNHKFNQAVPYTDEWFKLMKELFHNQVGENTLIFGQLTAVLPKNITIGKGCSSNDGCWWYNNRR